MKSDLEGRLRFGNLAKRSLFFVLGALSAVVAIEAIKYQTAEPIAIGTTAVVSKAYSSLPPIASDNPAELYLWQNNGKIDKEIEEYFDINLPAVDLRFLNEIVDAGIGSLPMAFRCPNFTVETCPTEVSHKETNNMPLTRKTAAATTIMTVKSGYIHERAHAYTWRLWQHLAAANKLHASWGSSPFENPTISEGIAEYFCVDMGEALPRPYHPPRNRTQLGYVLGNNHHYEVGRHIVKPILDTLGVEAGITTIYTRAMITEDEIVDPDIYLQRILNLE